MLAHQSQQVGRDLTAEEIERHAGAACFGYVRTDEQIQDCNAGRHPGLPYRYLVRHPSSSALAWKAFYTLPKLREFCDAYGCRIYGELMPGSRFAVLLPADGKPALPLSGGACDRYCGHWGHDPDCPRAELSCDDCGSTVKVSPSFGERGPTCAACIKEITAQEHCNECGDRWHAPGPCRGDAPI